MRTAAYANCAHCFSNLFTHSTTALSTRIARTAPVTPLQPSRLVGFLGLRQQRGSLRERGVLVGPLGVRPAEPLGGPGRPPPTSPSSPSLQPAETLGNIKCYRVHYVGTRVPVQQRRLERRGTLFLPGTLFGYRCTRTTATLGTTICYRVHYLGTSGYTILLPGTLSGYTCTRTTAMFRTFRTLGYNAYNSGVHVYPCSYAHKKLDLPLLSLCFQDLVLLPPSLLHPVLPLRLPRLQLRLPRAPENTHKHNCTTQQPKQPTVMTMSHPF